MLLLIWTKSNFRFNLKVYYGQEAKRWQIVQTAVTILMGFQVRGCGFISVTTVEGTSVTTAGQPQVVVFAALTANPTTPMRKERGHILNFKYLVSDIINSTL